MDSTDPRLTLKTTPPRVSGRLLDRPALELYNARLHDKGVVHVHAPAGFGKTSLLSQWRRRSLLDGRLVAWLTADEDDKPERFTQGLALAMERASCQPVFGRVRMREVTRPDDSDRLTEWLSEVAKLEAECVLMVDELERLPAATMQQSVSYVLSNLPSNLRVVIGSRARLRLQVGEMFARGAVALLTADSLRFSLSEAISVMKAHFGRRFNVDLAARIHELTDGWPLGLQLMISAMNHESDIGDLFGVISAQTGDLRQHFISALLSRLPPDRGDFLVRVSIADRIHPELCAALTGRGDSAQILEELRETTPILCEGLDSDWSTMHHLVRDFLRDQFERLPLAQRKAAHAALSAWLEEQGLTEEAARHALSAGHEQRGWDLAEKSLFGVLAQGQVARVNELLDQIPQSRRKQRPHLLLTAAWNCNLSGRPDEAILLAERVLRSRRSTPQEILRANIALSGAAICQDKLEQAEKLMRRWRGVLLENPEADEWNGINQLAWLALHSGDPVEARRLLSLRRPQPSGGEPSLLDAFHVVAEGMVDLWEGQVRRATRSLGDMHDRMERRAGRQGAVAASLAGLLALALSESAQMDQAMVVLANRLTSMECLATPGALIAGYRAAAQLAQFQAEDGRSLEILEGLCTIARKRGFPRASITGLTEMIRLHTIRGRAELIPPLLSRLNAQLAHSSSKVSFGQLNHLTGSLARLFALKARSRWSEMPPLLDASAVLADKLGRNREGVEIKLLRVQALHESGQDGRSALSEAIRSAHDMGLMRLLQEEWVVGLRNVIAPQSTPIARQPALSPSPGRRKNGGTISAGTHDVIPLRATPNSLLTQKEKQTLELLSKRLSNKQIAKALDLGEATVKWHLKNVFTKLNATTRSHAVQRARILGILMPADLDVLRPDQE